MPNTITDMITALVDACRVNGVEPNRLRMSPLAYDVWLREIPAGTIPYGTAFGGMVYDGLAGDVDAALMGMMVHVYRDYDADA